MEQMCHCVNVTPTGTEKRRTRLSIDVPSAMRRRIRLAAARRDQSIRDYVLEALRVRLDQDVLRGAEGILALDAASDPVLAELWDNPRDAIYD
jgi:uncharacterized protein (DUF1778 family)